MNLTRNSCPIICATLLAIATGGCGYKYRQSIESVTGPYHAGLYDVASEKAIAVSREANERDKLVLLLEEGAALRAAGRLEASNRALDKADKMFETFDAKAKVRLDREAVAALSSPAALDYEGYGYDRIMMNLYKALNSLEQGKPDDARVEITRIADAQAKCEQRYQDKIKQAADATKESKTGGDPERLKKDPKFARGQTVVLSEFPEAQDDIPPEDLRHKALYSNPFAEYLQGVFFLSSDAPGEREVGRVAFRNVLGMVPKNPVVAHDAADAETAAAGGALKPKTYVFFETGMAPRREEVRIDIPVFAYNIAVKDTKVDYIGIAFPKLSRSSVPWDRVCNVSTAEGTCHTEVLADVDAIVAREFKNEMPLIITRAVISAATKAAAQYAVASATSNDGGNKKRKRGNDSPDLGSILARTAVGVYSAAMNEADLRTWRTLPRQVQVASCPTPADGKLVLRFGVSASPWPVKLTPGKTNIVWVRRPATGATPQIRACAVN